MPSIVLLALLSAGIGIQLAVTAFLVLRFLEGRDAQVRWWAIAFTLYTAVLILEGLSFVWPQLLIGRHLVFLLAAAAMARGFGPQPLPFALLLGVGAMVLSTLLLQVSPVWAAVPPSLMGGFLFIRAALGYAQLVGGLDERSSRLVFSGLLLTGLLALDYPFLPLTPRWVGVGGALS